MTSKATPNNAARELKALLGDDIQLLNPDNATRELKALLGNDIQLIKGKNHENTTANAYSRGAICLPSEGA